MEEVLKSLENYIETKKVPITKISKQIGYSRTVISRYLQGKYNGDKIKLEKSILAFLTRESEKEILPKESIPFVKTNNVEIIFEICKMAHIENDIGVILGESGVGKTRSLKEYAQRNPDVVFIEADLSYTTKVFFRELHKKLGMDGMGSIYELFNECCEKLKDSGRLIIIDEAENLPYRVLDMIRRLYDKANVGIILAGLPRLLSSLRGKRGEFKQLYSRVGMIAELEDWSQEDVKELVNEVFPNANGIYKTFFALSKGNGRKLEKLILRTSRAARASKKEVTEKLVRTVAEMLLL